MITHPLLKGWLSGTTCAKPHIRRSVLFENEEFIVLKHASHAEYCGRAYGSQTCCSYAVLYRKADVMPGKRGYTFEFQRGVGYMARWEGRIARSKVLDDCRQMGIEFTVSEATVATAESGDERK